MTGGTAEVIGSRLKFAEVKLPLFVVTYDLIKEPESSYVELKKTLKAYDSVRYQLSAYFVSCTLTQANLFAALKQHMHDDDRLAVVTFTHKPSLTTSLLGTKAWIKKHFPN